jgi:hypothetical protein
MHSWKQEYKKRKRSEAVHPVFYGPDGTLSLSFTSNYAVSNGVLEV